MDELPDKPAAKSTPQPPSIRARRLGALLRKLRVERDLALKEVAPQVQIDHTWLSRIEMGQRRPKWPLVAALLDTYGIEKSDPLYKDLVDLAKQLPKKGWWHSYGAKLSSPFADLLDLEDLAAGARTYEPSVVPGLLQVEEYTRAFLRESKYWERPEDVDRFAEVRMARQSILTRQDPAPILFWAILYEGVVRSLVGGPEVMRKQLRHLIDITDQPNVTLQVLPYTAGAATGMAGPFVVFDFTLATSGAVVVENLSGSLHLEEPEELIRYNAAFDHLRASSLPSRESKSLISKIMKEI